MTIKTKDDAIQYVNDTLGSRWEVSFDAGEDVSDKCYTINAGGSRIVENGERQVSFQTLVNYIYKYRKVFNKR